MLVLDVHHHNRHHHNITIIITITTICGYDYRGRDGGDAGGRDDGED